MKLSQTLRRFPATSAHRIASASLIKLGYGALAAMFVGCASVNPAVTPPLDQAKAAISAPAMLGHITTLASDAFEGRAPGTRGEALTVDYLSQQFKTLGLAPGNPDGSYRQNVPLQGIRSAPSLTLQSGSTTLSLHAPEDFVAFTALAQPTIDIEKSELVFVGYGVIAPEFGWDDFKGVDVRGKTLVMLINDPPVPNPSNPAELDPKMFGGAAMTYYGRWTYKYEIAARLGAAAAIIVHETKPASYPYQVVQNSWTRENFSIKGKGVNPAFPPVPAWINLERAKALFAASGKDFSAMKAAALSKDFKPVPLGTTATFSLKNIVRTVDSNNVVAKIEGSDPVLRNEYVIYSAHWDHLGIDESLPGSRTHQIYHGAIDNASGVATILEIAKAYKSLPIAPKRTILFIATTSEEQGLLGAQYYGRQPLYPLEKTLVDINIDGINPDGMTSDITIVGAGKSTADDIVRAVAGRQGRVVTPDPFPENGSFYRADQFEFAKVGVPGIYAKSGSQLVGKSQEYARSKRMNYVANAYHKVDDIVQPDWDLSGAIEDARMLFEVGYEIAQGNRYPTWNSQSEFQRKQPVN